MSKHQTGAGAGVQASRRDLLRTTAGVVAAGLVGGAMLHSQAGSAQAVERDLASSTGQGAPFTVHIDGASPGQLVSFEGLGFHYQLTTTTFRNGSTGETLGRPEHGPVIITKAWDAATPRLFRALVRNEMLNQVMIEFVGIGGGVYHRMALKNVHVVNLEQFMHFNAAGHSIGDDPRQLEDVAFSFNEITIENLDGKTEAGDVLR